MIEKKQRANGSYYFVVKHYNGQIIVKSEDYASESARNQGIEALLKIIKDNEDIKI